MYKSRRPFLRVPISPRTEHTSRSDLHICIYIFIYIFIYVTSSCGFSRPYRVAKMHGIWQDDFLPKSPIMSGKETDCRGALSVKETCFRWALLQQPTKIGPLCKRVCKNQAYPKYSLPSDAAAYPHCNTRLHTNETDLCGTVCCSVLQCVAVC